ncbi:diaminopimelate epimerase [Ferroglobus placidus DSM 10642]|uniref:Diaminopimelate epimerase n=1 Tax=Ferroglobus placidus (strain DSM 10642 / AEDII12DO) TaxID=589924 RepID=D3S0G1_FERPA|nr:diaminopimelate epimerase [Ferroglobus placidus]ADC66224.1 diaminopimelate epimerase [Ferroglobus placidus DSM 10642]
MEIKFAKMHGNGNDFVIIDEFREEVVKEEEKPKFVRAIAHRNFGIGADGVIFVQKSEVADAKFRYFNSDGSEAEMCGNGIRCFSRYVVEEGYAASPVRVETLAGIYELEVTKNEEGWWVKVDMGTPKFSKDEIPTKEDVWGKEIKIDNRSFEIYAVNTGVPHAVIFVEDFDFDVVRTGRAIRMSELFPEGTNVNFVKREGNKFFVRTYERGVENETLSCGTGSVAVAAVARKLGFADDKVEILTRGGKLFVEFEGEKAYLIGGASRVADGKIRAEELNYEV